MQIFHTDLVTFRSVFDSIAYHMGKMEKWCDFGHTSVRRSSYQLLSYDVKITIESSLWSMNSVYRLFEDNAYCVKFYVHAVAFDSVPSSRRRVRLRLVCVDWTWNTMSYFLHLRSVEGHVLLDNVWRYILNVVMDGPRLELIYRLSKSDIRSHDRLSLKTRSFDHGSHRISVRPFLLTRSIRWLRLTQ